MIKHFALPNAISLRSIRTATAVVALLALAGCGSFFSGAGPTKGSIVRQAADTGTTYTLIPLSADTIVPFMRPPEAIPSSAVSPVLMTDIKLVPGDALRIMVSDSSAEGALFAPLASGGTVFEKVRVSARGSISLPYAGHIKVAGLSLPAVEGAIRNQLKGIAADPQAHVELIGDLSGSVLVAGAVKNPGRFSSLEGPLTLLDAINQAGGPVLEPHLVKVVLRTGNQANTFSYEDLLAGLNQPIPPHSEVIVERDRKRFVAMGAVGKPGLMDLPSKNPSLLEVLGSVGGLDEKSADARGVFVFRLSTPVVGEPVVSPKAQVFQLDMRDPTSIFLARQFLVMPEDAVYVTNASVYEFQKLISPIVQVLVLGRAVGN